MGRHSRPDDDGSEPADTEDQDTADRVGRVAADDDLDAGETGAEARSDDG
ncbi:hypothetical protein [Mycobacterium sp. 1274756.6]|nr:hypothetical protein [Mycobacterium sp. 1274756.6]